MEPRPRIALAFSQRRTEDEEVARIIELWLRDAPVLCTTATRLFAAYMHGRDVAPPIELATVWAKHLRRVLTAWFGLNLKVAGMWERVLNDVSRERTDAVLAAFGPDNRFGPEQFGYAADSPRFSRVWLIAVNAKRELLRDLAESAMRLPDDECVNDLVYATFLMWMIASPKNPGIVMDDAHRLGAFVDEWINPKNRRSNEVTPLPVPPERQLEQLGPRLVVDNEDDQTEDL